jgi:hypothetical protein
MQLKCNYNDVLPCVLIFNYLKYNNNNIEIIKDVQFKCLDDSILSHVALLNELNININNIKLISI